MHTFILSLLVGLAAADGITVQLFDDDNCSSDVLANVASNSGNQFDNSGCIANTFTGIKGLNLSPGFQCNIYSDASCSNFVGSVTALDPCDVIPGEGIECFSQALFDNPFAESIAEVTVGTNTLTSDQDVADLVSDGIKQACGSTGCDPTNKASFPFNHLNQEGQQTVSLSGNYDNTNQRDYMMNVLTTVVQDTIQNARVDTTGSSESDDLIADIFSFYQIVINDQNGNNQAEMSVTIEVTTNAAKAGDCGGIIGQVEGAALGEIPAVGGILAKAFNVVCENAG